MPTSLQLVRRRRWWWLWWGRLRPTHGTKWIGDDAAAATITTTLKCKIPAEHRPEHRPERSSMHVGSAFCGYIPPYPEIRVDSFSDSINSPFPPAKLYLLSHTHSDHIQGLDAKSFGQPVVCSEDSKRMLLLGERASDRIAFDNGDICDRRRPWSHLKAKARKGDSTSISRDLLVSIPLLISYVDYPYSIRHHS